MGGNSNGNGDGDGVGMGKGRGDGSGDKISFCDGSGGSSSDGGGGSCKDGKRDSGGTGGKRGGNSKVENKKYKDSRHIDRGNRLLAGMEGRLRGGDGGGSKTELGGF